MISKLVSYIIIDPDDSALVYHTTSVSDKKFLSENSYDVYEVTSLSQLYNTLDKLGYSYEYIEEFIENRISSVDRLTLELQDKEN